MKNELQSEIFEKIKILESNLTGNLFEDLEIKGELHKLKMQLEGLTPLSKQEKSDFECIGCGS